MAVTYNDDLATDLDQVRFRTGDTTDGSGPRPSDGNFTDAELNALISNEGHWGRAVAAVFERLAAEWQRHPSFKADGISVNRSDIAKGFAEQAQQWRKRYGYAEVYYAPTYVVGQIPQDGYSDDVASDDVDAGNGEFGHEFEYVTPE